MPSKSESISIEVCADEERVRLARSQAVRRRRRARALEDRSGDKRLVNEQVVRKEPCAKGRKEPLTSEEEAHSNKESKVKEMGGNNH